MTAILEHAFQKATQELNESEQIVLAKFLLQYNLHEFLTDDIGFISDYNADTQQAIRNAAERNGTNEYSSCDDLFAELGV